MKTIRFFIIAFALCLSQFVSYPSVKAKQLSEGCNGLNGLTFQHFEPGGNVGTMQTFELGEVIVVTAALDSATKAQVVILGHDQKPVVGPVAVPATLIYPVLQSGQLDLTFKSIQTETDGSITFWIRCLPGIPVPVQAGGNQFRAGSSALVNNLGGKPLQLFSSPDDAAVVMSLPANTSVQFTLEPLQIKQVVWYRVRFSVIDGWTRAKLAIDGNQVDSLVPYSAHLTQHELN